MAKILIVGCGSIGIQLAQTLSGKGHEVTGLKRHPPKADAGKFNYFTADISSADQLKNLPVDFEVVYFIVSPDGRNKESYQGVYEIGLNNLLNRFSKKGLILGGFLYRQPVFMGNLKVNGWMKIPLLILKTSPVNS